MNEIIENHILRSDIASILAEDEKKFIFDNCTFVKYNKGETIFKQNSYASFLLFISKGMIKKYVEGYGGRNIVVSIDGVGEYIGFSDIHNDLYSVTAVAADYSELYLIKKECFHYLINKNPKFSRYFTELLSKSMSVLLKKMATIGTKQMHGRLADSLIYLIYKYEKIPDLFNHLSRKDIAEMSGMSTESAIRLLTEFKNEGLIRFNGKVIEINNKELLYKLRDVG